MLACIAGAWGNTVEPFNNFCIQSANLEIKLGVTTSKVMRLQMKLCPCKQCSINYYFDLIVIIFYFFVFVFVFLI